ncbi:PREDICTED: transmembrane channel-like protein 5 isoform X3 [Vollenhovia emeryi]|uniref:transmembrane channel-like protein 5 isoform X3 n=1 Tax=Vollenhovia emeryi TaxID=411798 RepID=UPI0005F5124F|nr:PREDICTED: transmembrane channel-like protein 5 isoform X3 [Vollenhovia emeryi]
MSSEIREGELGEYSDQYVQMQQLLPTRLANASEGHDVSDDLRPVIPYATLRMHNIVSLSNEECASAIANHLQSSDRFMQADPRAEQFRMETVRTIPQCLTVKRAVRSQLQATVSQKTIKGPISCWKLFKYNVSLKFTKIRVTMQNLLSSTKLWHRTIKTIESHHGSGTATYFKFLRWLLLLNVISCILRVISSYRKFYVETRGMVHNLYSSKIFCGWDFSVSSSKAAALQSASIYKELEELLAETRQRIRLKWFTKCWLTITQLAVTSIVIFMICGAGGLVWTLLSHYGVGAPATISIMIVPIVITIIIHIFPAIISYLTSLEFYSNKRTELYVTVVRSYAAAATIIGTLFVFWIINSTSHCWQTHLGEEIYRLVILDFIAMLSGACLHVARSTVYKRFSTKVCRPEFDIARNTLNLIYNQTLFWMGFYFSPLMSVLIVIKLIFTFYVKRYELKRYYQRPSRPWRAAQTQTLFLALAFLGIIVVLFTIGYIITNVRSDECGPFRDHLHTWDFIVDGMLALKRDSPFWSVVSKLARPVTGAVILIAMCIAVYCLRAKAEASKEMLRILSDMLLLQSQDKQFLLKSFGKCASKRAPVPEEINLSQDVAEQNCEKGKILLSRRRNLPSTSFEER